MLPRMRIRSCRRIRGAIAVVVLMPGATAAESESDEVGRWVPALAVRSAILAQKAEASVSSGNILGPGFPYFAIGSKIRPTDESDEDRMVTPIVSGSLELMTPGWQDLPGRPRLFAHADAGAAFARNRTIAGENRPDEFALPSFLPQQLQNDIPEPSIVGQGSRTKAEVKRLLIGGGAGVAFTVELLGRRLRLKPSFEVLREEIEVEGAVQRAVHLDPPPAPGRDLPRGASGLEDFRLIALSGREREVYHGIGPGLELEAEAARVGSVMLTVFLSGRAVRFLGDLDLAFSAVNEYGEQAAWTFEKERWAYGADVGLRFRWVPE